MTLEELVQQASALLAAHPEAANAKVITEGCDCYGDAQHILLDKDGEVQITRDDGINTSRGV